MRCVVMGVWRRIFGFQTWPLYDMKNVICKTTYDPDMMAMLFNLRKTGNIVPKQAIVVLTGST